jgi:4-hydroxymandelate oxidase
VKDPVKDPALKDPALNDPAPNDPAVCVTDLRDAARRRLAAQVWDYVEGGSGSETTVEANRVAFDDVHMWPRVLTGVSEPDLAACLLGTRSSMPVAVAPMALQRIVHPDGEMATARAAKAAGVPFTVSTMSSDTIEDVAGTGASTWLQLYWLRDRAEVVRLVRRAEDAGCEALMLTVDVPVMARRPRDIRNQFTVPEGVEPVNLAGRSGLRAAQPGESGLARHTTATFDPGLGWRDVEWLRSITSLPLALKGILHPDDARRALRIGVDAVIVSNHGGRQLDGAVPSLTALPAVVAAVAGQCPVLFDSGVRSGTDILKALALGAAGVLVGRPVLWGLASYGEDGVRQVLSLLRDELATAMILAGCADVASANQLRTTAGSEVR